MGPSPWAIGQEQGHEAGTRVMRQRYGASGRISLMAVRCSIIASISMPLALQWGHHQGGAAEAGRGQALLGAEERGMDRGAECAAGGQD